MNSVFFFSTSFRPPFFQACDDHRSCHRRRGALLHLAGSARLLPPEAEEAQEEGDTEEDPARTRGGHAHGIALWKMSWVLFAMR